MKRTVLIVEDHPAQRKALGCIVSAIDDEIEVKYAADSATAYKMLMETTIDVFLIDIILETHNAGDTSGIRLAGKLRTIEKYRFTPLIFVTALEDPEIYAYKELHCYGYIEKPIDCACMRKLLEEALKYRTQRDEETMLYFRKNGVIHPVRCRDIIYMEMLQHRMHIYRINAETMEIPYKTCGQILEEADEPLLQQCSRSNIINKRHVANVDIVNRQITMCNGARVGIGVTYIKKMKKEFQV